MKKLLIILALAVAIPLFAQDDLLKDLDSEIQPKTEYTSATFKSSRIVTGHSVENQKEGQLEFRISHRFGRVNSGFNEWFGLDKSFIFYSFEYGVTDWLELGLGRTNIEKTFNGFTKVRLLSQSKGEKNMPLTLSYAGAVNIKSGPYEYPERENYFSSRLTYVNQLLIARKFTEAFSLQITPTHIHRNLVPSALDNNDLLAIGIGGRYKLSKRMSVNAEYFYVARPSSNPGNEDFVNPLSIGLDIETGGHVFQIMLTNSNGMIDKHYIADNSGDWLHGDIHLGFNISRAFSFYRK